MALNEEGDLWFYESRGERKGAISEGQMVELISAGDISHGTAVWKKGFPDWINIEDTQLKSYLDEIAPPPLKGSHVDNTVIWILAFAPVIGYMLEWFFAGMLYQSDFQAEVAVSNGYFFLVTVALNIGLCFLDEKRLEKAGHDTRKFKGWVWLVPVYIYQRMKFLGHNAAYFAVWCVCFGLIVF